MVTPFLKALEKTSIHHNLAAAALVEKTIRLNQGKLNSTGALVINTGKFTGRSPKDRFIVNDDITATSINWGDINQPISAEDYDTLYNKVINHLNGKEEIYCRDAYACANEDYRLKVRVYNEHPWQNLFVHNMFLRPTSLALQSFQPDWTIFAAPSCMADASIHGTRQENFAIINFTKQEIIIGGTAYTGEIKKGIFSVLNYILPVERQVLSMHCSANVGHKGDTALFFGLSGTGKTTLSTDKDRRLIGDDEHGWSKGSVFNFEGGCYAKTINLSKKKEPEIWGAIKFGAMLENIGFQEDGVTADYEDSSITQNTRVSYPIYHIENIMYNSRGDLPRNIFFLTCDAFGVIPPISRLSTEQAMYHFISGYTAKIAGTELGITEPQATFSACFGEPFLPLHPSVYADLLGQKIETGHKTGDGEIKVWLINTGWSGGPYGTGSRIHLGYTRAMIKAALDGELNDVAFEQDPTFGFMVPQSCPDVPNALLNPRDTWPNELEYDEMAADLAGRFIKNFRQYRDQTSDQIIAAGPISKEITEMSS